MKHRTMNNIIHKCTIRGRPDPLFRQTSFNLGMGNNKNFKSQYIMRVIIVIIDIIMISLNSATATKIMNITWKHLLICMFLSYESYDNHGIYTVISC